MNKTQIFDGIKKSAEAVLGRSLDLKLTDTLVNGLGMESIDVVDFIFELERTFEIEISMKSFVESSMATGARKFMEISVQDVVNFLEKQK